MPKCRHFQQWEPINLCYTSPKFAFWDIIQPRPVLWRKSWKTSLIELRASRQLKSKAWTHLSKCYTQAVWIALKSSLVYWINHKKFWEQKRFFNNLIFSQKLKNNFCNNLFFSLWKHFLDRWMPDAAPE